MWLKKLCLIICSSNQLVHGLKHQYTDGFLKKSTWSTWSIYFLECSVKFIFWFSFESAMCLVSLIILKLWCMLLYCIQTSISRYFAPSILPSILTRCPVPADKMQPYNMMQLPLYFTLGMVLFCVVRLDLHHINCFEFSLKCSISCSHLTTESFPTL